MSKHHAKNLNVKVVHTKRDRYWDSKTDIYWDSDRQKK